MNLVVSYVGSDGVIDNADCRSIGSFIVLEFFNFSVCYITVGRCKINSVAATVQCNAYRTNIVEV